METRGARRRWWWHPLPGPPTARPRLAGGTCHHRRASRGCTCPRSPQHGRRRATAARRGRRRHCWRERGDVSRRARGCRPRGTSAGRAPCRRASASRPTMAAVARHQCPPACPRRRCLHCRYRVRRRPCQPRQGVAPVGRRLWRWRPAVRRRGRGLPRPRPPTGAVRRPPRTSGRAPAAGALPPTSRPSCRRRRRRRRWRLPVRGGAPVATPTRGGVAPRRSARPPPPGRLGVGVYGVGERVGLAVAAARVPPPTCPHATPPLQPPCRT